MRVRVFELRLIAVVLTVLWAAAACVVLLAYRPGGPLDLLVGGAAALPFFVSVSAIVWPPVVRTARGGAAVIWLGLTAALLLIPSFASVTAQVLDRSAQPLLPSLELVYPWLLALLATALFAGLGVTRRALGETGLGRRRFVLTLAFALVTTSAISGVFAGVSLADDVALQGHPAPHSRFGPTAVSPEAPRCGGQLRVGATSHVDVTLEASIDQRPAGEAILSGVRSGEDVSWTGEVVRADLFGEIGTIRLGAAAWVRRPDTGWTAVDVATQPDALLDATAFETALTAGNRETAEELGLEFVEGARARHCRVAVDGPLFIAAFPQARWLVGDAEIGQWRGTVDYWIFGDAEIGQMTGEVGGSAAPISPHGIGAMLKVSLTATDRDTHVSITPPRG